MIIDFKTISIVSKCIRLGNFDQPWFFSNINQVTRTARRTCQKKNASAVSSRGRHVRGLGMILTIPAVRCTETVRASFWRARRVRRVWLAELMKKFLKENFRVFSEPHFRKKVDKISKIASKFMIFIKKSLKFQFFFQNFVLGWW